jgi:plastocyanin
MKKSELRQIIREELKAMREAKPPLRGKVDGDKITYNHISSRRHNITAAGNRKALPSQALLMQAAAESDLKSREDDYEMKTNELGHTYLEKK